jgi:putative PIN family toxin of toxin-antitoxin system
MAKKTRAVYDAGIILQATLNPNGPASHTLRLMDTGVVEVFLSPHTRDEIEDILTRPEIRRKYPHLADGRVEAMLTRLDAKTTLVPTVPRSMEFPRDPDDEPVINLAIYVKADYLVARDKDLFDLGRSQDFRLLFPFVQIVDPVTFLNSIGQEETEPSTPKKREHEQ